jgi:hypothetical protein
MFTSCNSFAEATRCDTYEVTFVKICRNKVSITSHLRTRTYNISIEVDKYLQVTAIF